jgi:Domain of unknown function (DUF4145)
MAGFKCPSCPVTFPWIVQGQLALGTDSGGRHLRVESCLCPDCGQWSLRLIARTVSPDGATAHDGDPQLIWPRATNRPPCPPEVPDSIREDYREACLVLADSPKASAALSRRCLQNILREKGGVTPGSNLVDEIKQVVAGKGLPSAVATNLDAVRQIGAFAAHPIKSKNTGEIIDVEEDEADWNLDVVEALMDIYYVQPVRAAARLDALNEKLADAGKKPIDAGHSGGT